MESVRSFQYNALFNFDSKVGTVIPVIQMGNPGSQKIGNVPKFTESVSGELGFSIQVYLCFNGFYNWKIGEYWTWNAGEKLRG